MAKVATAKGRSALFCPKCKNYFSKSQEQTFRSVYVMTCSFCHTVATEYDVEVHVIPSSVKHLKVGMVRDSYWWHSTSVPRWDRQVPSDLPIHLGTKNAAMRRWNDTGADAKVRGRLYKMKLAPKVPILRKVVIDDHIDGQYLEDEYSDTVVRYVNLFESIGSISLITRRDHFEIVDSFPLG